MPLPRKFVNFLRIKDSAFLCIFSILFPTSYIIKSAYTNQIYLHSANEILYAFENLASDLMTSVYLSLGL